jgi:hypothetical protein
MAIHSRNCHPAWQELSQARQLAEFVAASVDWFVELAMTNCKVAAVRV